MNRIGVYFNFETVLFIGVLYLIGICVQPHSRCEKTQDANAAFIRVC